MNELKNYGYIENLELSEYLAFPIYITIILIIAYYIQNKNIKNNSIYRYYTIGVGVKLFGAVAFCLVYIFVYKGGDTILYFESARALNKLLIHSPQDFMKVVFEKPSVENYFLFDGKLTGYPHSHFYFDSKTFLVTKLLVPCLFFTFNSYVLASILFSWLSFFGIWKLFIVFNEYYPRYSKQLSFSILFLPSAVFWGSGILKDTITLSATCWFVYSLYMVFIKKKSRVKNILILVIVCYVILSIKPYILVALFPGSMIWIFYEKIVKIKSQVIKYFIIPIGVIASVSIGFAILFSIGDFNLEKLLIEASEKQSDLKQSYYAGNSFDIGSYEPTISGALGVAPAAMTAGLYRPFLWEAKNIVMAISGLENFIYLIITVLILFKLEIKKIIRTIFSNPLLIFCLTYSVLFSLIVGLSTANFGAMVRFKIAYLSEFVSFLIVLYLLMKEKSPTISNNKNNN